MDIGFFVDWLEDYYQQGLLAGARAEAAAAGVGLIAFEGGTLESGRSYDSGRSDIYSLARGAVDGLIVATSALAHFVSIETIASFLAGFAPLPIVSISEDIAGLPSVRSDNAFGIAALVAHMARVHGKRRIAFLSGPRANRDAVERLDAFREALDAEGLELDPALMGEGDFQKQSGIAYAEALVKSGAGFDAVIAANDVMALGVLELLQSRGVQVPWEVAVAGFDDAAPARHSAPPLTTVRQPFEEQGRRAVRMLVSLIRGEQPPSELIHAEPLYRESCGCFNLSSPMLPVPGSSGRAVPAIAALARSFGAVDGGSPGLEKRVGELLRRFDASLAEPGRHDFPLYFNLFTAGWESKGVDFNGLNSFVTLLRERCLPPAGDPLTRRAEDLFQQLRALVGERFLDREMLRAQDAGVENRILNNVREEAMVSEDEASFYAYLTARLPVIGVSKLAVLLYRDEGGGPPRLVYKYDGGRAEHHAGEAPVVPFPLLAPFDRSATPRFLVVEAILYRDALGILLLEPAPDRPQLPGEMRRLLSSYIQGQQFSSKMRESAFLKSESERLNKSLAELRGLMGSVIKTLAMTVETRDPYTAGHESRVADLARSIAKEMGLSRDEAEGIRLSALVHDLGKIYVPAEILNKPGKLREAEFSLIKMHSEIGYDILKNIEFPWPIADIVLQHHERMDGSGYPRGLRGADIRVEARVIAVADVVEAMASHRPYREALGLGPALEEVRSGAGTAYDAEAVGACLRVFESGYEFKR